MSTGRALVLGGGGLAGISWITGMLHGMAVAGLDVTDAEFIVGTSAGSTVAAQVGSGVPVELWFERQVDPRLQNRELRAPGMTIEEVWETRSRLLEGAADPGEQHRRIAALALATETVPEATRRAVVAGRLRGLGWPERRIAIVAVDASTGARRVFDSGSRVDLVDAVAASSAVPGVWPPVTIDGSRYIDGGVHSLTNADLAVGWAQVLVVAPMPDPELDAQVDRVNESGRAQVLSPDVDSFAAFGTDPLDPAVRTPAARAGFAQGRRSAASVTGLWTSGSVAPASVAEGRPQTVVMGRSDPVQPSRS